MAGALWIPLDKFSNCLFSTSLGTQRCPGWSYRYTRLYLINFQRPKLNFRYEKRSTQLRINLETKLKTFPWLSWSYPIKIWGKLVEGILSNDRTNKQTNRDYTLIYRWQNVKKYLLPLNPRLFSLSPRSHLCCSLCWGALHHCCSRPNCAPHLWLKFLCRRVNGPEGGGRARDGGCRVREGGGRVRDEGLRDLGEGRAGEARLTRCSRTS